MTMEELRRDFVECVAVLKAHRKQLADELARARTPAAAEELGRRVVEVDVVMATMVAWKDELKARMTVEGVVPVGDVQQVRMLDVPRRVPYG
jgi:hypothetical protein